MKIQCPQCSTVYSIDGSKIPEKGGRIPCRKCGNKIHIPGASRVESQEKRQDSLSEEVSSDEFSEKDLIDKYIKGKDEDEAVKSLYDGICQRKKIFPCRIITRKADGYCSHGNNRDN